MTHLPLIDVCLGVVTPEAALGQTHQHIELENVIVRLLDLPCVLPTPGLDEDDRE